MNTFTQYYCPLCILHVPLGMKVSAIIVANQAPPLTGIEVHQYLNIFFFCNIMTITGRSSHGR